MRAGTCQSINVIYVTRVTLVTLVALVTSVALVQGAEEPFAYPPIRMEPLNYYGMI